MIEFEVGDRVYDNEVNAGVIVDGPNELNEFLVRYDNPRYGNTWSYSDDLRFCTAAPVAADSQDQVNHPAHYTSDPSGIECIQITRWRNFNVGNAIKYLWRAGLKDSDAHIEDLRKAVFYINDEIERLRNATNRE